jgi:alanyl aminopeptidase
MIGDASHGARAMRIAHLGATLVFCALGAHAAEVPEYRLPAGIEPNSQVIELTLDPSQEEFSGMTSIELSVAEAVERIGINQVGLTFANVQLSSGGKQRSLQATAGEWERSWLADGKPIAPGDYTLTIEYSGKYATDSLGMHRARFEDRDYVFTQMEAMYARRAFPSFDEPSFKIPFRLVINAPEELTVVANTPVEAVENNGGWQRVTFMETPPLPTYLLAYAVGPLDRAAIDGLSVPGHIYVPKGYAGQLGFVLRETPKIAAALEKYFGSDYPFRKLDFVAVPEFAFGAMENPGLIAYRTDLLLVGDDVSGRQAVSVLNVLAHEIAHIWYGDVVTMAWWDDLWLNEAFASWMAATILETEYPQYETVLRLPQARAFKQDELTTARAIRGEVRNSDEIFESVGIHYTKGRTLLRMLERYVGSDVWQRAIRRYVDEFAWSNATEKDLWAVVSKESGLDISKIAGDYLNQPGFAMVNIDAAGKVTQERYARKGPGVDELLWHIPLHVKYKADGQVRQTYMLLQGRTGSLDLPSDSEWIFPDAGANGYYRWSTSRDQLQNLVDDIDELTGREKIALLDNCEALLNAGSLAMADYMYIVQRLLKDPHPLVTLPALLALQEIGDDFVAAEDRDAFAVFVDNALSARYAAVGIRSRAGDSEAMLQMRPRLVRILGQFGSDENLVADAAKLVDEYFAKPESVSSDLALEAMRITALNDDGGRYDQYVRAYLNTDSADQKSNILAAMYFDRPDVVRRHLEFSLSDEVQAVDSLSALYAFTYVLDDHSVLYDWLDENFERVVTKAPAYFQALMPRVLGGSCDRRNLDLLTDFFAERGDAYATNLATATEADEACIARRIDHAGSLSEFLAP